MASNPDHELYAQQFVECYTLYQQEKFDKCIASARLNLSDPTLPVYFRIKTLVTLANAEEYWEPAEECRVEAERLYQLVKQHMDSLQDQTDNERAAVQELRSSLDITLEGQARDAPDSVKMSYEFACYPPREGNLDDAIYAQGFQGAEDEEQREADAPESACDDNEEQPGDADELATVEGDLDVNTVESLKNARLEDAEEIQTAF